MHAARTSRACRCDAPGYPSSASSAAGGGVAARVLTLRPAVPATLSEGVTLRSVAVHLPIATVPVVRLVVGRRWSVAGAGLAMVLVGIGLLVTPTASMAQPCEIPESAYQLVARSDPQAASELDRVQRSSKDTPEYASLRYEALRGLGYNYDCGNVRFEKNGVTVEDPGPKVTQGKPIQDTSNPAGSNPTAPSPTTVPASGTAPASDDGGASTTTSSQPETVDFDLAAIKAPAHEGGPGVGELTFVALVVIAVMTCAWSLTRP